MADGHEQRRLRHALAYIEERCAPLTPDQRDAVPGLVVRLLVQRLPTLTVEDAIDSAVRLALRYHPTPSPKEREQARRAAENVRLGRDDDGNLGVRRG